MRLLSSRPRTTESAGCCTIRCEPPSARARNIATSGRNNVAAEVNFPPVAPDSRNISFTEIDCSARPRTVSPLPLDNVDALMDSLRDYESALERDDFCSIRNSGGFGLFDRPNRRLQTSPAYNYHSLNRFERGRVVSLDPLAQTRGTSSCGTNAGATTVNTPPCVQRKLSRPSTAEPRDNLVQRVRPLRLSSLRSADDALTNLSKEVVAKLSSASKPLDTTASISRPSTAPGCAPREAPSSVQATTQLEPTKATGLASISTQDSTPRGRSHSKRATRLGEVLSRRGVESSSRSNSRQRVQPSESLESLNDIIAVNKLAVKDTPNDFEVNFSATQFDDSLSQASFGSSKVLFGEALSVEGTPRNTWDGFSCPSTPRSSSANSHRSEISHDQPMDADIFTAPPDRLTTIDSLGIWESEDGTVEVPQNQQKVRTFVGRTPSILDSLEDITKMAIGEASCQQFLEGETSDSSSDRCSSFVQDQEKHGRGEHRVRRSLTSLVRSDSPGRDDNETSSYVYENSTRRPSSSRTIASTHDLNILRRRPSVGTVKSAETAVSKYLRGGSEHDHVKHQQLLDSSFPKASPLVQKLAAHSLSVVSAGSWANLLSQDRPYEDDSAKHTGTRSGCTSALSVSSDGRRDLSRAKRLLALQISKKQEEARRAQDRFGMDVALNLSVEVVAEMGSSDYKVELASEEQKAWWRDYILGTGRSIIRSVSALERPRKRSTEATDGSRKADTQRHLHRLNGLTRSSQLAKCSRDEDLVLQIEEKRETRKMYLAVRKRKRKRRKAVEQAGEEDSGSDHTSSSKHSSASSSCFYSSTGSTCSSLASCSSVASSFSELSEANLKLLEVDALRENRGHNVGRRSKSSDVASSSSYRKHGGNDDNDLSSEDDEATMEAAEREAEDAFLKHILDTLKSGDGEIIARNGETTSAVLEAKFALLRTLTREPGKGEEKEDWEKNAKELQDLLIDIEIEKERQLEQRKAEKRNVKLQERALHRLMKLFAGDVEEDPTDVEKCKPNGKNCTPTSSTTRTILQERSKNSLAGRFCDPAATSQQESFNKVETCDFDIELERRAHKIRKYYRRLLATIRVPPPDSLEDLDRFLSANFPQGTQMLAELKEKAKKMFEERKAMNCCSNSAQSGAPSVSSGRVAAGPKAHGWNRIRRKTDANRRWSQLLNQSNLVQDLDEKAAASSDAVLQVSPEEEAKQLKEREEAERREEAEFNREVFDSSLKRFGSLYQRVRRNQLAAKKLEQLGVDGALLKRLNVMQWQCTDKDSTESVAAQEAMLSGLDAGALEKLPGDFSQKYLQRVSVLNNLKDSKERDKLRGLIQTEFERLDKIRKDQKGKKEDKKRKAELKLALGERHHHQVGAIEEEEDDAPLWSLEAHTGQPP